MLLICFALSLYTWILFIRILLSWVQMTAWRPPAALAPLIDLIHRATDPVLDIFRRHIPPVGGFDLSPIFIFLILSFVKTALRCPPLLGLF